MSWARIDDQMAFHRKVVQAGNAAVGAWARMTAWCAAHLTDGHVPDAVARLIGSDTELVQLVEAGLLDQTEDGFAVHDYLDWNPSADQVRAHRELEHAARVAGGKARASSAKRDNGRYVPAETPAEHQLPAGSELVPAHQLNASPIPSPSRPHPFSEKTIGVSAGTKPRKPAFDLVRLYALYPKTGERAPGLAKLARQITTPEEYSTCEAGIRAYAQDCKRKGTEEKFIASFLTFVNQRRWEDWAEKASTSKPTRPRRQSLPRPPDDAVDMPTMLTATGLPPGTDPMAVVEAYEQLKLEEAR